MVEACGWNLKIISEKTEYRRVSVYSNMKDNVNFKKHHDRFNAVPGKLHDITQKDDLLFVGLDRRHFAYSIEPAD